MRPCRRVSLTGAIALATALSGPALAQTADAERIKELERKLERSLELIDKLSTKIAQIEQANAATREAQAQTAQQATKIDQIERHVSEIGNSLSRRSADEGVPIHGFVDVGFVKSNENNPTFKGRKGAAVGTLDLYLTPQIGDRIRSLVEIVFESDQDGKGEADLERLQVGYAFNDKATGWLGRFHTPYGYWNTAFHHGAQIQTSVMRPRFLEFEDNGGILPAHTVGAWLNGSWRVGDNKFGYDLFAGNAPQVTGLKAGSSLATANPSGFSNVVNAGTYAGTGKINMRQSGATSHRTSAGFNAWFEPYAVDGLRLGVHGLRADVIDDALVANRTQLNVLGGYFTYHLDPWEVLGEYYNFRNKDRSGTTGTHGSWAGYTQLGYNRGKWTTYGRAERTKLDQTDNYFGALESGRSYQRLALGLRYDLDPKAALKLEFASTRKQNLGIGGDNRYPELRMQYAIRF